MIAALLKLLDNADTERRIAAFLVGLALPVINSKFGLNIPSDQVIAAMALALGYVVQSAIKAAVVAPKPTVDQAVAAIAGLPPAKP